MAFADKRSGRKTTAILLAGPIFLVMAPFAIWQAQPYIAVPLAFDWRVIIAFLPLAVMATIVGGITACIPVIVGATALEALGRTNVGCRLAAFWGITGAAMATLPLLLLDEAVDWAALALALTGGTCALICRRGVRWDDDAPLSDAPSPAICTRHDT